MSSLNGASVIVAGATGGLGAPMSQLLAEAGAKLTLTARRPDGLAALPPEVLSTGTVAIPADLCKPQAAQTVVDAAMRAHGRIDGVVCAIGAVAFGPAMELPDQVLIDLFTLNTLAPIRLLKAAYPHLLASAEQGRAPFVINISAVVAEQPTPGMAGYAASKSALTAFDRSAARELRRKGIRLIDVRPPHTETGLAERPVYGHAPRLPRGLPPRTVAKRIVGAITEGDSDVPSGAFILG